MRQVMIRRGQIGVESVPAPLVEKGHLLVEVAYSFISPGTEVTSLKNSSESLVRRTLRQPEKITKVVQHLQKHGLSKTVAEVNRAVDAEKTLGYSCSGKVIQVGDGVTGFHPGDMVACAGGGHAPHAEIVLVPKNLVVRIPPNCDLRSASSVALGAIALQGVRRADVRIGDTALVMGLGLLGLLTLQILKSAGAHVIGLDLDARRVQAAREMGADHAFVTTEIELNNEVRHLTAGQGVDVTLITAASSGHELVQQAMEITRKKGKVVVVGAVGMNLRRSPFYEKELDFLISSSYGPGRYDDSYEIDGLDYPFAHVRWTENRNMAEYLRLIADGKVRLDLIIDQEFDIADAAQAYESLLAAEHKPVGVILRYPESSDSAKRATTVQVRSQPGAGKLRVAVVGAGAFAKGTILPTLQQLTDLYSLRAIVSSTGANAKNTAQRFQAEYATTDFGQVLADSDVDLVVIATRHNLHAQQVLAALESGKHVFCEKPLAINELELDRVVQFFGTRSSQASDAPPPQADPTLMVGFNRRFSPAIRRIRELVQDRQAPLMISYRVNAGYVPPEHWVHGEEGGGRIVGEACHMFDVFQYLASPSRPTEVTFTALQPARGQILASDNRSVTVAYDDGSVATLVYTSLGAPSLPKEYVEVFCDGKTFVVDDYKSLAIHGSNAKGWSGRLQDKGHLEEFRVLGQYLGSGGPAPIPLGEIFATTEVSLLASGAALESRAAAVVGAS